MPAQTRHEMKQETYDALETAVRAYCATIVQDPERGVHVRPRNIKQDAAVVAAFPDDVDSDRVRGRWVGSILQDADYATHWSKKTYCLDSAQF